jgi:hypothetical protein
MHGGASSLLAHLPLENVVEERKRCPQRDWDIVSGKMFIIAAKFANRLFHRGFHSSAKQSEMLWLD